MALLSLVEGGGIMARKKHGRMITRIVLEISRRPDGFRLPRGARSQIEPFVIHSTSVAVSRANSQGQRRIRSTPKWSLRCSVGGLRGEPRPLQNVAIPNA